MSVIGKAAPTAASVKTSSIDLPHLKRRGLRQKLIVKAVREIQAVQTGYTIPGAVAQPGGGAAPLAFTPVAGMWWNPSESGTGYNIQVQQGTLVATMFGYAANGDPMWYLIVGNMANMGARITTTATLDKYRGRQCASCMYQMPSTMGNDGTMTITFSSPTAATVRLPGGRATQIQPYAW